MVGPLSGVFHGVLGRVLPYALAVSFSSTRALFAGGLATAVGLGVVLAVLVGFGCTPQAPSSFPLSVDLRATKLASDGSGGYVVVVRNRGGHRAAPITLGLLEQTVRTVGAGTVRQHLSLGSGSVSASVPLGMFATKDGRTYRSLLPGLAAGASTAITVDATAASFGDALLKCFYVFVAPGDRARPPAPTSSIPPSVGASFCEGPRQVKAAPTPLPFSVELRGPADTRVGAKATYTITVTSHAKTTIRDATIGISQETPASLPPRAIPLTTDWPNMRTSKAGGEEALLTHLQPDQSVSFHVTMRAPEPLRATDGKLIYATDFHVSASRRSRPGEFLAPLLVSRLHS
jgi:hypothetical protein